MGLPILCDDQLEFVAQIDLERAAGKRRIFGIAPCGFGKTVVASYLIVREPGYCLAIAHRRELIVQMSCALAANGVRHRVFGPTDLIRKVVRAHTRRFGRSFYDPNNRVAVASVDSLNLDNVIHAQFLRTCTFVLTDEGHHVLRENKWGKVLVECVNAWMFFPTATGFRGDGKGLGDHADGYGDAMVLGPTYGEMIEAGRLLDYRIVLAQPDDYERPGDDDLGVTGEFKKGVAEKSVKESKKIIGSVVDGYREYGYGRRWLVFTVSVDEAVKEAQAFKAAGIPAEVVHGGTPTELRDRIFDRFERREVWVIVNVGIAGEGTDIPGVEGVSMAAPIGSMQWFDQVFGRPSRLSIGDHWGTWHAKTPEERKAIIAASDKPFYRVIDHCGNIVKHKPPNAFRRHTLERRDRRTRGADEGVIPQVMCLPYAGMPEKWEGMFPDPKKPDTVPGPCFHPYEKTYRACPYCQLPRPRAPVGQRSTPDQVDGNLWELDPAAMAALVAGKEAIDTHAPLLPIGAGPAAVRGAMRNHLERQQAQASLRAAMDQWSGVEVAAGSGPEAQMMRFYFLFGADVLSAQALGRADAEALRGRIEADIVRRGFILGQGVDKV
jgi:DNA repair protein RadD